MLSHTGAPKPYAQSLAKIVECTPWRREPVLASGAVFRKRQILRRIEMLLDGSRDSKPGVSQVTFVVILMCLFGAFSQITGAMVFPFLPPSIQGLGQFGGFSYELLDQSGGRIEGLEAAAQQLIAQGNQTPGLTALFQAPSSA